MLQLKKWLRKISEWGGLFTLTVFAGVMFFYQLGYPSQLIFDETYHIPSAQKYLNGVFFEENHPPLGKLLIAAGEKIFQTDGSSNEFIDVNKVYGSIPEISFFGYRFFSALAGVGSIILFYLLVKEMGINKMWALFLAFIMALDNAFVVQSRSAMLDSFLIIFLLLSGLFLAKLVRNKGGGFRFYVLVSLLAVANSGSSLIKHTGFIAIFVSFLVVVVLIICRRVSVAQLAKAMAVWLVVFMAFYVGIWKVHYSLANRVLEDNYYEVGQEMRDVLDGVSNPGWFRLTKLQIEEAWKYSGRYNKGVPKLDLCKEDEIGSPWYYWPFGGRAINYRWETMGDGNYRYIYLVANPVVWGLSLTGVVVGSSWLVTNLWRQKSLKKKTDSDVVISLLLTTYWFYLFIMSMIGRVMYLYHYLPLLFIGLLLFTLIWEKTRYLFGFKLTKRSKTIILAFVLLLASISYWFYSPLTYYQPLTENQLNQRMLLDVWSFKPQN